MQTSIGSRPSNCSVKGLTPSRISTPSKAYVRQRRCGAGIRKGAPPIKPALNSTRRNRGCRKSAMLNRLSDVLRKTTYTAPINGVVTYIAVASANTCSRHSERDGQLLV